MFEMDLKNNHGNTIGHREGQSRTMIGDYHRWEIVCCLVHACDHALGAHHRCGADCGVAFALSQDLSLTDSESCALALEFDSEKWLIDVLAVMLLTSVKFDYDHIAAVASNCHTY